MEGSSHGRASLPYFPMQIDLRGGLWNTGSSFAFLSQNPQGRTHRHVGSRFPPTVTRLTTFWMFRPKPEVSQRLPYQLSPQAKFLGSQNSLLVAVSLITLGHLRCPFGVMFDGNIRNPSENPVSPNNPREQELGGSQPSGSLSFHGSFFFWLNLVGL